MCLKCVISYLFTILALVLRNIVCLVILCKTAHISLYHFRNRLFHEKIHVEKASLVSILVKLSCSQSCPFRYLGLYDFLIATVIASYDLKFWRHFSFGTDCSFCKSIYPASRSKQNFLPIIKVAVFHPLYSVFLWWNVVNLFINSGNDMVNDIVSWDFTFLVYRILRSQF